MLLQAVLELADRVGSGMSRETKRLVQQERLEDRVQGEREDGEEGLDDEDGHQNDQDGWSKGLSNHSVVSGELGQADVSAEAVDTSDSADAEPVEDEADTAEPSETGDVLQDEGKSVPGGLAEEGVGEGNLDVGVLSDELDALLEEPQAVASDAEHELHASVLSRGLNLSAVVLKHEADHLADSNEGGTESDRTHVVSESPPHTRAD